MPPLDGQWMRQMMTVGGVLVVPETTAAVGDGLVDRIGQSSSGGRCLVAHTAACVRSETLIR
jgi:hypothetical protein